ncbi:MAG: hypothetical protein BWX66_00980 [Deltaproteobacteria bacterium ADurb.Bin058]|nr:MAG: hypothetical protein BWX66_00980 [Deltaproteobacteria bacterium ADurb.Bin058]
MRPSIFYDRPFNGIQGVWVIDRPLADAILEALGKQLERMTAVGVPILAADVCGLQADFSFTWVQLNRGIGTIGVSLTLDLATNLICRPLAIILGIHV